MNQTTDPFEYFFEMPWSDGLPVVTPTPERLTWMLGGTSRDRRQRCWETFPPR